VATIFLALVISQIRAIPTPAIEPMSVICCDKCSDSHACQISFDGNFFGFRTNCKGLLVQSLHCRWKSNVAIESLRCGMVRIDGYPKFSAEITVGRVSILLELSDSWVLT
jgi:hypothetical protein